MFIYRNTGKSISIYRFTPDKLKLIEFKKRYLENIKSVIVHSFDPEVQEIIKNCSKVMFDGLDKKEKDGNISYIEETKNESTITKYINGGFDSIDPISVIGGRPAQKSLYSGDIYNQDGALLFETAGYKKSELIVGEGILLSGPLSEYQPLLSCSLNNLVYPQFLEDPNEETLEFLKLFKCLYQGYLSLDRVRELSEDGLIGIASDFDKSVEKSELIFSSYKKAQKNKDI